MSTASFSQFPDMIQQLFTLLVQQVCTGRRPRPHPQVFSTSPLTTLALGGWHIPRGPPALLTSQYAIPSRAFSDSEPSTSLTVTRGSPTSACSRPTWSACQNTGGRVPPPVSDCTSLGWGDLFPAVAAGGPGTTPGEGGLKAPLKAVSPSRPYWTYCQRTPPIQSSPTGSPFPHSLFISWFKTMVSKLLFFLEATICFFFNFWPQHVGSQFPDQGLNPRPLQWQGRVLTTRPPGKSRFLNFLSPLSSHYLFAFMPLSNCRLPNCIYNVIMKSLLHFFGN